MPVLTFVHERLTIVCFLLIKPRASPVGEKALFFTIHFLQLLNEIMLQNAQIAA